MRYKKRTGRKSARPPEAEFNMFYYDLDISAKDLAKKYNVAENTIYNWAHQFRKEEVKNA